MQYLIATYDDARGTKLRVGFSHDYKFYILNRPALLCLPRQLHRIHPEFTEFTGIEQVDRWFGLPPFAERLGQTFYAMINQGLRRCEVVAINPTTGEYLFEYEMPAGTSALNNSAGKSVSYRSMPKKWRALFDTDNGCSWDSLINNPQGGGR